MQDYMNNVLKGHFVPTGCQYVNNASSDDFILPPQPGETCQKISGFKGQMLHAGSTCTINNYLLFFELRLEEENKVSVLLYNQDNTYLILTGVKWDESGPFYNSSV